MRAGLHRALTAALMLFCAACAAGEGPDSVDPILTLAVPERGAYTGCFAEFGDYEDDVTLEKIEGFASLVGKHQAIVAFSNYWGRGHFPAKQARIVAGAGAVPLIFWNPWDNPDEGRPSRFDLSRILAGEWDAYIDQWGRDAKAFGRPLLVSWGLEMNGDWFPWSGVFHGGGDPVPGGGAGGAALPLGPETLKAAYRHVVDRVRSAGANNIAWIFHVNNTPAPGDSWNRMAAYYPGSAYADWIAMSAYGKQFPGEGWVTVKEAILDTYPELAAVDPSKPILLAEWGVGEFPRQGSKGAWIREFFSQAKSALPRLGGMVFWHERWQNGDLSYSNLRVNSSLDSLTAFREGIADPFWLAEPRLTTVDP